MQIMNDHLPNFYDISPTQGIDLDERCAIQHFLGKTREEVLLMIQDDMINYEEDFACMGVLAFCYYMPSILQVIKNINPDDERLEEAIAAVLFILEMRYLSDTRNIDKYKEQTIELLNISERKIQCYQKMNQFDRLVKREQRKINSKLKKIRLIRSLYL